MEKQDEHGHGGDKPVDEKAAAYFAKEFNFSFDHVHSLLHFSESMREFAHHLTENHYYSEALNKQIVNCTLELHLLSLELSAVELQASRFATEAATVFLAGGTNPKIDSGVFTAFKEKFLAARERSLAVHVALLKVLEEIKKEHSEKKLNSNGS